MALSGKWLNYRIARLTLRGYQTSSLGPVGVRVNGLDLRKPLSDTDKENLRKDVVKHELLLFKGQSDITDEQTLKVAELFGPLELKPQQGRASHPKQSHPAISRLSNNPKEGLTSIGNTRLHIDGQYLLKPNDFALYHTRKASKGSQTWFVSMTKALDKISKKKFAFWDSLWQRRIMHMHGTKESSFLHPLTITHPRTNKNVLCTHLGFIENFVQYYGTADECIIPHDETNSIVDDIQSEMKGKEDCNMYKHEWDDDDIIITDNWSVLHVAGPQTQSAPRDVGVRIFHRILTTGSTIPKKDYSVSS